ncbi:MAG TPA: ADP-ribosylglycohydrolase family protein, partial [Tepidisphaeraceae bacterium]|nr:ADP-ribosylglycohydrolase family protein [Tepidisphaeraceae bacterium]
AVGDVAGAVVEAESPGYIARTYRSIDEMLATPIIPEFTGPDWRVGRFTDDTQMTICVAEWLLAGEAPVPDTLLARFAAAYQPWRRYGSGTAQILRAYPEHQAQWRELATMMFPHGSYGDGSAMRVAPIGLACFDRPREAMSLAIESSRPTHCHPLAFQGAAFQAIAVATAVAADEFAPAAFLQPLRAALGYFAGLMQDTARFSTALDDIERGLARGASCAELSETLGTGIEVYEAAPMALYCFLRHPQSFADVIHQAVFIGGDTDTIASMAGAVSGALLGEAAVPANWLAAIREETYPPGAIRDLADQLYDKFARD